jgi:carbamoyltransferase
MDLRSVARMTRRRAVPSGTLLLKYATYRLQNRFFRRVRSVDAERVLGIASTGHGASLAYVDSSGTVRSSQLERWAGVKHMMLFSRDEDEALRDPASEIDKSVNFLFKEGFGRFPDSCIFEDTITPWFDWLLGDLGVRPEDIDLVVTSDGHFATGWSRLGPALNRWFPRARTVRVIEHHEIHQRQAFWPSGFPEAAVLTLDNCGEPLPRLGGRRLAGTISMLNQDGEQKVLQEFLFPEMSSGTIFDITTRHVGFPQGDEGKTMGLSALGRPTLFHSLRKHLRLHDDGGFEFLSSDDYRAALTDYVAERSPGGELTERHEDVAYAGQAILDLIVPNAWRAALRLSGRRDLVYAGGVALNSVANDKAWREARPERFYIPPNPGDPGHALGCALFGAYEAAGWERSEEELSEYLGPTYPEQALRAVAAASPFPATAPEDLEGDIARVIANGHIVARFAGGAEFGPRALGNRSILCDPRRPGMKDYLNLRVKHREPFRPFAPAVLEEHADAWFDVHGRSAYMLRVVPVHPDKLPLVPAVAHADDSARVQTLARSENPDFWALIAAFHRLTGVPLLLNTSFNLAGKPIVETPAHARDCFAATEIDVLVLGPHVLSKRPLEYYLATDSGA